MKRRTGRGLNDVLVLSDTKKKVLFKNNKAKLADDKITDNEHVKIHKTKKNDFKLVYLYTYKS